MMMKVTRYSFCFVLIFTISFVMMISGNAVALGYEEFEITGNINLKSNTIEITGETTKIWEDVIFTVKSPNGNLMSVDQTTPQSNGYFGTNIGVGGSLWKQDGTYTIIAQQGSNHQFRDWILISIVDGGFGDQYDRHVTISGSPDVLGENVRQCTEYCDAKSQSSIIFPVVLIVVSLAITIPFIIKKKRSKKLVVPSSTEKPQEENITYIDKQIAINEEKIRKMEEESKRLDEES